MKGSKSFRAFIWTLGLYVRHISFSMSLIWRGVSHSDHVCICVCVCVSEYVCLDTHSPWGCMGVWDIQGSEETYALSLQVFSRERTLQFVALLQKETCNLRYPVHLGFPVWMRRVTHRNEGRITHEWNVSHLNDVWHYSILFVSRIGMKGPSYMNERRITHE